MEREFRVIIFVRELSGKPNWFVIFGHYMLMPLWSQCHQTHDHLSLFWPYVLLANSFAKHASDNKFSLGPEKRFTMSSHTESSLRVAGACTVCVVHHDYVMFTVPRRRKFPRPLLETHKKSRLLNNKLTEHELSYGAHPSRRRPSHSLAILKWKTWSHSWTN